MPKPKKKPASSKAEQKTAPRRTRTKAVDPLWRRSAEHAALAGVKERHQVGHLAAGRMPPGAPVITASEARRIDDAIRDARPLMTEDQKLLNFAPRASDDFTRTDPWRVMR